MKGIVLAAGKGTRLYPMTLPVCKPLLPVYDKPLIYYPISVLMQAGIRDILIIIPPGDEEDFRALLGDGSKFGLNIQYKEQKIQRGIADAFIIGKDFIGEDEVCLVLGDNIFHAQFMELVLKEAVENLKGATVFGYKVDDPRAFGVVEFDEDGKAISIEEKPEKPKSDYIIPGLYFYDNQVVEIAENLKPSARGELEITDVNIAYMERGQLDVIPLEKGLIWLDAGTEESLLESAMTIKALQKSGQYVGCLEEHAYRNRYINKEQLKELIKPLTKTRYGEYLEKLID
ncbi:MAG: glucose-1-phosphate thymidylyltransferase RfbA [Eubacteriaceae bacterium]|nr:glucose-1-phosphate thymidylyltransferase RfbA [Eubacteriaceae bacterium]